MLPSRHQSKGIGCRLQSFSFEHIGRINCGNARSRQVACKRCCRDQDESHQGEGQRIQRTDSKQESPHDLCMTPTICQSWVSNRMDCPMTFRSPPNCRCQKPVASVSLSTDRPHLPWKCPVCGAIMHVLERLSAAQLLLRSPPFDGIADERTASPSNPPRARDAQKDPVSHIAQRRSQAASQPVPGCLKQSCRQYPAGKLDLRSA